MLTELHWAEGPWPGKLALAARPRGGDWLADEMEGWRRSGVDTVVSLLTHQEEMDLNLLNEAAQAGANGMAFVSLPIADRQAPSEKSEFAEALRKIDSQLSSGENVALHCRQGIGRTGLVAACLLVGRGYNPNTAVTALSAARGITVPETPEQLLWIDDYAAAVGASAL